jgi:hypothetical protein
MFYIPGHKGNANQKHIKIPPHSCQESLPSRTQTTTNIGKDMEKKEQSHTIGENVN